MYQTSFRDARTLEHACNLPLSGCTANYKPLSCLLGQYKYCKSNNTNNAIFSNKHNNTGFIQLIFNDGGRSIKWIHRFSIVKFFFLCAFPLMEKKPLFLHFRRKIKEISIFHKAPTMAWIRKPKSYLKWDAQKMLK